MPNKTFVRLPKHIVPENYLVTLKADLPNSLCTGTVEIFLKVFESGSVILLDAIDIDVKECALKLADGTRLEPKTIRLLPEDERLELTFAKNIPTGECRLLMKFESKIGYNLRGFYKTKTKTNDEGRVEEYGVTQFAASEARRCFPCWDEPSFKATFQMTFIVPKDFQALSNMDSEDTTDHGDGWKRVSFPKTPKMSSYLVAFAIGKYDFVESSTKSKVRIRVYTPKGKKASGEFALKIAVRALDFYEEYFDIPYPLPKADLLAVSDFAYGAMENWGLVTFRESLLLFDDKRSDTLRKQRISLMIAHELAHQWFGNLVTMDWWTHLWLNEGFAMFMEVLCMHSLSPECELWAQSSLILNRALELDALDSSHPIEVPINHPSETDEIFDMISYDKGASIICMLYDHIGAEEFRKGMKKYLTKHRYSNAQTEDLWSALQTTSQLRVKELMEPWTSQMGFPQLTVQIQNGVLHISQEKFYSNPGSALNAVSRPQWKVPVSIATSVSKTPVKIVLEGTSTQVKLPKGTTWVHLNSGATGVFRVLYDEPMFSNLVSAIRRKELPNEKDRHIIHSDILAQVASSYRNSAQLLELTSALVDEEAYIVWVSITEGLKNLAAVCQGHTELHDQLCSFARKIYSKIFASVGWEKKPREGHTKCLLRSLVIGALIYFDDEAVLTEARKRFHQSLKGDSVLPGDLKLVAYTGYAKSGDASAWFTLWRMVETAESQEDEQRLLLALTTMKSKEFILKLLDLNISDKIRSQNGPLLVEEVAKSPVGRKVLWQHYTQHYPKYHERFSAGYLLPRFIKGLTGHFNTLEMADEIEAFFKKNYFSGIERSLLQARESVIRRAAWFQRDKDCLTNFFKQNASK